MSDLEREDIGGGITIVWSRERRVVLGVETAADGAGGRRLALGNVSMALAQHIITLKLESEASMDAAARAFVKANAATEVESRETAILDVQLLAAELKVIGPDLVAAVGELSAV